jgi:ABC-type antimicrobial peptide transport system permease subunit
LIVAPCSPFSSFFCQRFGLHPHGASMTAVPGRRVYVPAMGLCIVAVTLIYLLPIMVGISALPDSTKWFDGYWAAVGGEIGGGGWLAGWVTAAGAVSCCGLLNTLLCTTSLALAAIGTLVRRGGWGGVSIFDAVRCD